MQDPALFAQYEHLVQGLNRAVPIDQESKDILQTYNQFTTTQVSLACLSCHLLMLAQHSYQDLTSLKESLWIMLQSMEERAKQCPLDPVTVEHAGGADVTVATGELS